jgi:hypothetical protein
MKFVSSTCGKPLQQQRQLNHLSHSHKALRQAAKMSIYDDLNHFRDRMTKLETQIGQTPEEGLRYDVATLRKAISGMEKRSYVAYGICLVLVFIVEHFFAKV